MAKEAVTLLMWVVWIAAFLIIVEILRKAIPALVRRLKAMTLKSKPPVRARDLAYKYSHAHDPFYIEKEKREDAWLAKYGSKKEAELEKKLAEKFKKKKKSKTEKTKKTKKRETSKRKKRGRR